MTMVSVSDFQRLTMHFLPAKTSPSKGACPFIRQPNGASRQMQEYWDAHRVFCPSICFGDMYWIVPTMIPQPSAGSSGRV